MNWYKKAQVEIADDEAFIEELAKSKWIPVNSSWISDVAYHEGLRFLEIRLNNGKEYLYPDIPKKVFEDFMQAKSKGEFFNRIIREKYRN